MSPRNPTTLPSTLFHRPRHATVVVLWILKMTVGSTYCSTTQSFKIVADPKKKVETELGSLVEVKYQLVVPCNKDGATHEVTWNMAKEYLLVALGEVSVQFLRT